MFYFIKTIWFLIYADGSLQARRLWNLLNWGTEQFNKTPSWFCILIKRILIYIYILNIMCIWLRVLRESRNSLVRKRCTVCSDSETATFDLFVRFVVSEPNCLRIKDHFCISKPGLCFYIMLVWNISHVWKYWNYPLIILEKRLKIITSELNIVSSGSKMF